MNPIKVFLTIFAAGILLTFALGIIGYPANPEDVAQGEGEAVEISEFVTKNCASCHGGDLSGGVGPSLLGLTLTEEEIIDIIISGPGTMPPNLGQGREAEIAEYLLSLNQ